MSTLPRVNRQFQPVSSNLGKLSLLNCSADASTMCSFLEFGDQFDDIQNPSSDPKNLQSYVESVAIYGAFGVLLAILAPIAALIFCLCRCWLCCCCCTENGTCGKGVPTKKEPGDWCGFVERRDKNNNPVRRTSVASVGNGGDGDALRPEYEYPGWSRWTVRGLMYLYVVMVVVWIVVGHELGNRGLTKTMKAFVRAPSGVVDLVRSLNDPFASLLVDTASDALRPLFIDLNATVQSSTDLGRVIDAAECVLDGIDNILPDPDDLIDFVDDVERTVNNTRDIANTLKTSVNDTRNTVDQVFPLIDVLIADLNDINAGITSLETAINDANDALTDIDPVINGLTDPTSGANALATQLQSFSDDKPTKAAAESLEADYTTLASGLMNGTAGQADRTSTITDTDAMIAQIDALPNLATLSDNLEAHNQRILDVRANDTVGNLIRALENADGAIDAFPSTVTIRNHVDQLNQLVSSITLQPLLDTIEAFNNTLNSFPSFDFVRDQLARIRQVSTVIECVGNLLDELTGLNETVYKLPDAINDITSVQDDVNATYYDALDEIESLETTLDDVDTQIDDFGSKINPYVEDIEGLQDDLVSPVNFSGIDNTLADFETRRTSLDLAAFISSAQTLNDTIFSDSILAPTDIINYFDDLQTAVDALRTALGSARAAVAAFDTKKRCVGGASKGDACADIAGCPLSTCETGISVCVLDTNPDISDGADCSSSNPCVTLNHECSLDLVTVGATITALGAYADAVAAEPAGIADLTTSIADLSGDVTSLPDTAAQRADLTEVLTAIREVPTTSAIADLDSLKTNVDPSSLPFDDVLDSIDSADEAFDSVPWGSTRETLVSFNESIAELDEQKDKLDNVVELLEIVKNFLNVDLLNDLGHLTRENLERAQSEDGLRGVLSEMSRLVTTAISTANSALRTIDKVSGGDGSGASEIDLNVTEILEDNVYPGVDAFEDQSARSAGAIYYLTNLISQLNDTVSVGSMTFVSASEAGAGATVFANAAGQTWADDALCLTDECLDATIDDLNTKNLNELEVGSTVEKGSVPVPLSREIILLLPYALPLLIAIVGLIPALGFCGRTWHRHCAACSACLICTCIPWLFLFFGGLLFPMTMVFADACYGAPNVGYAFVAGSRGHLCVEQLDGVITVDGNCRVEVQGSTVEIDLEGTFAAIMGSCAGREDILDDVYESFKGVAKERIDEQLNNTVNDMDDIRQPLRDVVNTFGDNAATAADNLLDNLAETIDCEALNTAINNFIDPICCELTTSIYWIVSSWYLIAFTMCLCGYPASILGYKRFPQQLWGDYYESFRKPGGKAPRGAAAVTERVRPHPWRDGAEGSVFPLLLFLSSSLPLSSFPLLAFAVVLS